MKKVLVPVVLALATSLVVAQEMGRVISTTPVIQQVGVPRQVCSNQTVTTPGAKSGAGAIVGALAGGAMGNAVGDGGGKALATVIGLVGGAIVGDRIEGGSQPQTQNVQTCSNQVFYENRAVSYNVVYEYAGKQYSVNMPNDPGPYVRLQITPVSSSTYVAPAASAYVAPVAAVQQIYVQPAVVASYPGYTVRPIYGTVEYGYYNGYRGHGHWR